MQKGFSTLEVVIAVFVVSVLASCTVPNAARIVDRVSLDYEVKRLYTEMRFLQSHERMTSMRDDYGFEEPLKSQARLIVTTKGYRVEKNADSTLYYGNDFLNGVTASQKATSQMEDKDWVITFDDMGEATDVYGKILNGHIVLTSRRGKKLYFIFDTVGRFRGSRTKP